ncbi:YceI family protein [Amycolatopsis magusensis]|uniref:YceI family protein n=1 Tax=Amycolatopsis magusensis TaxID=882444 RepID=UPI0024A9474F|nr:YceI family protein [Amycolatopsis magusensis]MDI5978512.1 YceI family protein [Amycolatopsis magusensis]
MTTVELPAPGTYRIDPAKSQVGLAGRHLFGLAPVRGRFAIRAGTIQVADPITDSLAEASIDVTSFDTGNDQRDNEVRSPRYLDAGRFPLIEFVSGRVIQDNGTWKLTGNLTVRETTREVALDIETASRADDGFTVRAHTKVNRTDFGVTTLRGLGGSVFTLTLDVTATTAHHP